MLVVQRVFRAKRTNLHEKYDYPLSRGRLIQVPPKRGLLVSPLDLVGQLNLLERVAGRSWEGRIITSVGNARHGSGHRVCPRRLRSWGSSVARA